MFWLHEGDANTKFFYMSANGRRRQNQITKTMVKNEIHIQSQAVGQALAEHFRSFSKKWKRNPWKWCGQGARVVTQEQLEILVRPFLEEEVQAAIKGLNGEGSVGPDGIPIFFPIETFEIWIRPM